MRGSNSLSSCCSISLEPRISNTFRVLLVRLLGFEASRSAGIAVILWVADWAVSRDPAYLTTILLSLHHSPGQGTAERRTVAPGNRLRRENVMAHTKGRLARERNGRSGRRASKWFVS